MDPALLAYLTRLSETLDRVCDRQDAMTNTLLQQSQILAEQQGILREHVRRSVANEELVRLAKAELEDRLKPVEHHVDRVSFVLKVFLWLGGAAGAVTTVLTLIKGF